jgi:hypothetical protein
MVASALDRFDVQIVSFGASATVAVYRNYVQIITFTGDVRIGTMTTGFDCIALPEAPNGKSLHSEIFVMTDDTKNYPALQDLALNGAGTTTNWTNSAYTNINAASYSDSSPASSNTNAQLQQYNVTDSTSGSLAPAFVKWTIRAALSASPSVTKIAIGVNSGGSVAYGTGSTKTITGGTGVFGQYEQCDINNPVTSAPYTLSELNALQLNLEALT